MLKNTQTFIKACADFDLKMASLYPDQADKMMTDRLIGYSSQMMKEKMEAARLKGRGGWWDKNQCIIDRLKDLLDAAVKKGDMASVLNYAGMVLVRECYDAALDSPAEKKCEHKNAKTYIVDHCHGVEWVCPNCSASYSTVYPVK